MASNYCTILSPQTWNLFPTTGISLFITAAATALLITPYITDITTLYLTSSPTLHLYPLLCSVTYVYTLYLHATALQYAAAKVPRNRAGSKQGSSPLVCGRSLAVRVHVALAQQTLNWSKHSVSACHSVCDSRPPARVITVTAYVTAVF